MAGEIAVGYISIIPETSKVAPGINRALGGADVSGAGKSIGSKLSSAIGGALKVGVAGVGVAAGGVLASAMSKGFKRLTNIENAQAKLAGLGNTAEDVAQIMNNANAAVKGTSFGLDEAATVAASAVASGIKPGQALEKTLKVVGDSAAIAGISMGEMGAIFNKVAASDSIQGEELAQLGDRGIPILQLLSKQLGVSVADVRKLASEGKINFATFQAAMESGMGGAALKMGDTFQGSLANMNAALGRFGAKLLEPVFTIAPPIFKLLTDGLDALGKAIGPVLEDFSAKATPALQGFIERLPQMWNDMKTNPDVQEQWKTFGDLFKVIGDLALSAGEPLLKIGTVAADAAGKVSVETWQVFTKTLQALTPVIEQVATVLADHPELVAAVVTAWAGAQTVKKATAPFEGIASTLLKVGQAFAVMQFGKEMAKIAAATSTTNPALSSFATMASRLTKMMNPLGTALQFITKPLMSIGKAVAGMIPKLIAFIGPWGWIAAAVAAVGVALWAFFTKTETGRKMWDAFMGKLREGWEWLQGAFLAVWDRLKVAMQPVIDFFDRIKTAATEMFTAFKGGDDGYGALESLIGTDAAKQVMDGIEQIRSAFVGLKELIVDGNFTGALRDMFGWEEDAPIVQGILKVREVIMGIPDLAKGVWNTLFHGDSSGMPFGLDENSPVVGVLMNIRGAVMSAWEAFGKIKPMLMEVGAQLGGALLGALQAIWGAVKSVAAALWPVIQFVASLLLPVLKVIGIVLGGIVMGAIFLVIGALKAFGFIVDFLAKAIVIAFNIISTMFQVFVTIAQWAFAIVATMVLAPLMIAWNLLAMAFQAAWDFIIKPIWDLFAAVVMFVWTSVLQPAFNGIQIAFQALGAVFSFVWNSIIKPAWDALAFGIQFVVDTIVKPAFEGLKIALNAVGAFFQWVWNSIIKPAWDAFGAGVRFVIDATVKPAFDGLKIALGAVGDFFQWVWNNVIKTAWDALGNGIRWVIDSVIKPAFDGLKAALNAVGDFFGQVVNGIKNVWDSLRGILAKPINFMINTVYNNGIARAWNTINDFLPGLPDAPNVSGIPEYATGGRITGPGTGTSDSILARLSNSEHVLTAAEVQKAGGHEAIYFMRALLKRGIPFTWTGTEFADKVGQRNMQRITPKLEASGDVSLEGMPIPLYAKGGEVRPAWEKQLEAGHEYAIRNSPRPYVYGGSTATTGGTDCSGWMSEIADVILGGPGGHRQWSTGTFPGPQAGSWESGLSQGFSVGISNEHTAGTLSAAGKYSSVNVESGGGTGQGNTYGGPAVGADHSQFPRKHHLKIGADGAFESAGGPSRSTMLEKIKERVKEILEKILSPIENAIGGAIGNPPPEWFGIPPKILKLARDKTVDTTFETIENLGDLLRSVYDSAKNLGSVIVSVFRDNGGYIQPGLSLVRNETGKPEAVLNWEQLQQINRLMAAAASGGNVDTEALAQIIGEQNARAVVDGLQEMNKATVVGNKAAAVAFANEFGVKEEQAQDWRAVGTAIATEAATTAGTSFLGLFGLGDLVEIGSKLNSKYVKAMDEWQHPKQEQTAPSASMEGVSQTPADSTPGTAAAPQYGTGVQMVGTQEVELEKMPDLSGDFGGGHDGYVKGIVAAAIEKNLPERGAMIGVGTALVESGDPLKMYANSAVPESLNFPHDAVGSDHDSVGLFQQRQAGWGTLEQRMDPKGSAMLFFNAMLQKFPNWQSMEPGAVAQGVQVSAFPDRYAGKMPKALEYVKSSGMFDQGGIAAGMGLLQKAVIEPERVLSPAQTQDFNQLVYSVLPALKSAMANSSDASPSVTVQLEGDAFTAQQVEEFLKKIQDEVKGLKVEVKKSQQKSVLDGVMTMA